MPGLNKRSVLNVNTALTFNREYPFINFFKPANFTYAYNVDLAQIDANGYAIDNSQILLGKTEFIICLPPSVNYSGQYVLKWTGTGTVYLDQTMAWTFDAGASTGATEVGAPGGGRFAGTNPRILVTPVAYPGDISSVKIIASDPSNTNDYIRDLKFYMLVDEADLNAGKLFRRNWKQTIINHNPGCIRFMNWTGGAATLSSNWSSQISPDNVSYITRYSGLVPYGLGTINPTTNKITVNPATGMPVSMKHGELVFIGFSGSATITFNPTNFSCKRVITNITNDATGGVVTSADHGFNNGQRVLFHMAQGQAPTFHQLHYKVATIISVPTTSTFKINVDTSAFGTWSSSVGSLEPGFCCYDYLSMEVGSRGEYPVLALSGFGVLFSGVPFANGGFSHFYFDKYIVGNRDTGPGAWIAYEDQFSAPQPGVPVEVCVALTNELNAMKTSGGAINCWITTPPRSLMSVDPDYTAAENWAVKAVDACLNGHGSWAGLDARAALLIEFSNETWNYFMQGTGYQGRIGQLRYGGASTPFTTGTQDISSMPVIRSIVMCQDLATAYPTEIASGRLIRLAAGQGTFGIAVGSSNVNELRVMNAGANVMGDAWNVGGAQPYTKFETFAWASYFDAATGSDYSFYTTNLTTYTANWVAAVGAAAKEAVCQSWIDAIRPLGEGTAAYTVKAGQFSTVLGNLGRSAIQYEGGYDWQTITGGIVDTQNKADFLTAIQNSAGWAAEQKAFFTSVGALAHHYHPSIYIQTTSNRHGYNRPNFNNWVDGGTVEGAALNLTWTAMGEYNAAQDTGGGGGGVTAVPLMLAMRLRLHA